MTRKGKHKNNICPKNLGKKRDDFFGKKVHTSKKKIKEKKKKKESDANRRGYWRFRPNQQVVKDYEQGQIVQDLESPSYDNEKVWEDAYDKISYVDRILEKYKNGEQLKTNEEIILNNYLDTYNAQVRKDYATLERSGIKAKDIKTKEGKIRQILLILKVILNRKNINEETVFKIFCKIKHEKFIFSSENRKEFKKVKDSEKLL